MKFEKVMVTPEVAQGWLTFNNKNRLLRKKTVDFYVGEINAGRWQEDTGETVKFDSDKNLLDGQHRLSAIVKAGVPVNMWVAYDVDPNSFSVIDSGLKRGNSDIFQISEIPHNSCLPTIIRMYTCYKDGKIGNAHNPMSSSELLGIYAQKPVFWQECAKNAVKWHKSFKVVAPSVWGVLGAILFEVHNDESMDFLDKLASGRDISLDGMYYLRDKFVAESVSAAKTRSEFKVALVIKMWNSMRMKRPLKNPKFDPFNEDFPTAI